mgnify:FL=1
MTDWDRILNAFWSKYYLSDDGLDIIHQGTRDTTRKTITPPTLEREWAVVLQPLHFRTKDEAQKNAMGIVVFEDYLQQILDEQPPPEETDL